MKTISSRVVLLLLPRPDPRRSGCAVVKYYIRNRKNGKRGTPEARPGRGRLPRRGFWARIRNHERGGMRKKTGIGLVAVLVLALAGFVILSGTSPGPAGPMPAAKAPGTTPAKETTLRNVTDRTITYKVYPVRHPESLQTREIAPNAIDRYRTVETLAVEFSTGKRTSFIPSSPGSLTPSVTIKGRRSIFFSEPTGGPTPWTSPPTSRRPRSSWTGCSNSPG